MRRASIESTGTSGEGKPGAVTESMDVFSAGCVVAELFREGAPLFTLSQLFKYREGEFSVDAPLSSIDDPAVQVRIPFLLAS